MMLAISTSRSAHLPHPADSQSSREQRIPSTSMVTSIAILPSAPISSSASIHVPTTPARRPKLQLNTNQASQTRSFGKGASLRLDTLSAVSPTIRNTFSNAYEAPASAIPAAGRPSLKLNTSNDSNRTSQESSDKASTPRYDSATASSTSTSSTESITPPPYKQCHSVQSILSNTQFPSMRSRKMSTRPFFPAVKKVAFREPLEEVIVNVKYIKKHSDIKTPALELTRETPSPAKESASTMPPGSPFAKLNLNSSPPPSVQVLSPASSVCSDDSSRQSPKVTGKRDAFESEGEDSCPETPIAGRRKRQRDWRWTLGPVNKDDSTTTSWASDDESN